jgi:hypothetical protein
MVLYIFNGIIFSLCFIITFRRHWQNSLYAQLEKKVSINANGPRIMQRLIGRCYLEVFVPTEGKDDLLLP